MIKRYTLRYNPTGKYYTPAFGYLSNKFKNDLEHCMLFDIREGCDNIITQMVNTFGCDVEDFSIITVELLVKENEQ